MSYQQPMGLCILQEDSQSFLYDPTTEKLWPTSVLDHPLLADLLVFCAVPRSRTELIGYIVEKAACSQDVAQATLNEIVDSGLLLENQSVAQMGALWKSHNWEQPFLFHLHTNELKKMDYGADPKGLEDKGLMTKYVEAEGLPDSYKVTEGDSIHLPDVKEGGVVQFGEILSNEIYHGHSEPFTLESLSWFLKLAYGETGLRVMPVTGRHVGKTSPSGGSRHPTEVYPIVLGVEGIENGLYHYNVEGHGLTLLKSGDYGDFVFQHLLRHKSRISFNPKVVVVFSTIFERSMFRYRESRSYRVMHYDLSHLLQTTSYLARCLNKHCYRSYTLDEAAVEKEIGIDGLKEAAMAVAAVG